MPASQGEAWRELSAKQVRGAQATVAGPAEADAAGLSGLIGDRAEAGVGCELVGGRVARAILAELGEDRGGVDLPRAREAHEQAAIGEFDERSALQQQARFDDFVEEFNLERPRRRPSA